MPAFETPDELVASVGYKPPEGVVPRQYWEHLARKHGFDVSELRKAVWRATPKTPEPLRYSAPMLHQRPDTFGAACEQPSPKAADLDNAEASDVFAAAPVIPQTKERARR